MVKKHELRIVVVGQMSSRSKKKELVRCHENSKHQPE